MLSRGRAVSCRGNLRAFGIVSLCAAWVRAPYLTLDCRGALGSRFLSAGRRQAAPRWRRPRHVRHPARGASTESGRRSAIPRLGYFVHAWYPPSEATGSAQMTRRPALCTQRAVRPRIRATLPPSHVSDCRDELGTLPLGNRPGPRATSPSHALDGRGALGTRPAGRHMGQSVTPFRPASRTVALRLVPGSRCAATMPAVCRAFQRRGRPRRARH